MDGWEEMGRAISMSNGVGPPSVKLMIIHQFCCRRYNIERLPSARIVKVSEENIQGSETSAPETYWVLVRQISVDSLAMGLE